MLDDTKLAAAMKNRFIKMDENIRMFENVKQALKNKTGFRCRRF